MYKNVLLAVDLNHEESWVHALPAALAICSDEGARIHVVTCIPDVHMPMIASYFPDSFVDDVKRKTGERLAEFCATHVPSSVDSTHAVLSGGAIYEMLIRYADGNDVELIVMGAYHPDLKDYLLGSNAEKVLRHARQSVLVIKH